jgi:hypothetical protein
MLSSMCSCSLYSHAETHNFLPPRVECWDFCRTQAIERILEAGAHMIIFADAALDSRVFAMAHERLAKWQSALWGWGGTIGVDTMDFYFVPEALWSHSKCPTHGGEKMLPPQSLFAEQVVLLEGVPPLPAVGTPLSQIDLWKVLQERYLLPPANSTHLYLFPGSVRHMHPEFDSALAILFKTDPNAVVSASLMRVSFASSLRFMSC